ncbi:MAG TPA: helix-turn-helix domain-containing protein [Ideonella sp.]|nr:helix-turn-helix domain-containing protein [Ideonella sp.]
MATRSTRTPRSSSEELGLKLLQSVREMKQGKFARVTEVPVNAVVQARQGTGMSQTEFAQALRISKRTLQEWEQGRRSPSGAAQALIRIAQQHPDVVRETLA